MRSLHILVLQVFLVSSCAPNEYVRLDVNDLGTREHLTEDLIDFRMKQLVDQIMIVSRLLDEIPKAVITIQKIIIDEVEICQKQRQVCRELTNPNIIECQDGQTQKITKLHQVNGSFQKLLKMRMESAKLLNDLVEMVLKNRAKLKEVGREEIFVILHNDAINMEFSVRRLIDQVHKIVLQDLLEKPEIGALISELHFSKRLGLMPVEIGEIKQWRAEHAKSQTETIGYRRSQGENRKHKFLEVATLEIVLEFVNEVDEEYLGSEVLWDGEPLSKTIKNRRTRIQFMPKRKISPYKIEIYKTGSHRHIAWVKINKRDIKCKITLSILMKNGNEVERTIKEKCIPFERK